MLPWVGGNPFLLIEALRGLAEGARGGFPSILRTEPAVPLSQPRADPPLIRALLRRRIDILSPLQQEVLSGGALIGLQFEALPLNGALGRPSEEVQGALERLSMGHQLLQRDAEGTDHYRFAHPLIWEVTLARLQREERCRLARRLADWWTRERSSDVETVARLYHDSGEAERALPWVRQALERSVAAHAHEAVERYVLWAREAPQPLESRVELELRVTHELQDQGAHRLTVRLLDGLLTEKLPRPMSWSVSLRLAYSLIFVSNSRATAVLSGVEKEFEQNPEEMRTDLSATLHRTRALLHRYLDEHLLAIQEARESLSALGQNGDPETRVIALNTLGASLATVGGKAEEAMRVVTQAVAIAERNHLSREGLQARRIQGFVAFICGDLPTARKVYSEVAQRAGALGWVSEQVTSLTGLCEALVEMGDLPRARAVAEEAAVRAEVADNPRTLGSLWSLLAEIDHLERRCGEAAGILRKVEELWRAQGHRPFLWSARLSLARETSNLGEPRKGLEMLQQVASDGGDVLDSYEWARLHLIRAEMLEAVENREGARREIAKSLHIARSHRHVLDEARALRSMARWEERWGEPRRADRWKVRAEAILRRCGVLPALAGHPALPVRKVPSTKGGPPFSERVLLHLASQNPLGEDEVAPVTRTQEGISKAMGVPQSNFAKVLLRMEKAGLLTWEVRPVKGRSRRLKVYQLTRRGMAVVRDRTGPFPDQGTRASSYTSGGSAA